MSAVGEGVGLDRLPAIAWEGRDTPLESLGGKGRSLHQLSTVKLPVPDWFCVPVEYYQTFIRPFETELRTCLEAVEDPATHDYASLSQTIRKLLTAGDLPAPLSDEVHRLLKACAAGHFAVRSSAACEDSASLSFAGLFDTYLYTPGERVIERIHHCWMSVFNAGALGYLLKNGLSPFDIGMAVVVQEMVDAEKSGVLFQANPSGRLDEIAVVAGYGLGEGVVREAVETDAFHIDRQSRQVRSTLAEKRHRLVFDRNAGEGLEKLPVPEALRAGPVLAPHELDALLALSARLEKDHAGYQDLEWAFDARGYLFLLQCRQITTIPSGPLQLYDNASISENYPGLTLPLTASVVQSVYRGTFYQAYRKAGYSRRILRPYEQCFANMVACIEGRLYYNLSNWYAQMRLLPFAHKVFIPLLEKAIGAGSIELPGRRPTVGRFTQFRVMLRFVLRFFFFDRCSERYHKRFGALYRDAAAPLDEHQNLEALIGLYRDFSAQLYPIDQFGRVSDTYLMLVLAGARRYFKSLGLDFAHAESLINGLMVGERDLEAVKPVQSLRALASEVEADILLGRRLAAANSWPELVDRLQTEYPAFFDRLCQHLVDYGDRTIGELKLETTTFRQDPMQLVALVVEQSENSISDAKRRENEETLRAASERTLAKLLNNPLRRTISGFLIANLRRFVKSREIARFNRTRYFGIFREIFTQIGMALTREGVIADWDDVFYLTEEEVLAAEGGERFGFADRIAARKANYAAYRERKPLPRMWLKGDVALNRIPQMESAELPRDGSRLKGVGCCPGTVRAKAVVVNEPDPATDVRGKIIVAENTDPGWVFLIMRAKGLVVERGGLLSHTAIVGREMGIPTIVGLENATSLIFQNQIIRMNGESGEVDLHA